MLTAKLSAHLAALVSSNCQHTSTALLYLQSPSLHVPNGCAVCRDFPCIALDNVCTVFQLLRETELPAQAENSIVKQVQAEKDMLLAQVRGQMSDMQRQHDCMASELQRKLDW